ncbi:hypothetical protein P4O66_017871, partial [Electrophorus voltai]
MTSVVMKAFDRLVLAHMKGITTTLLVCSLHTKPTGCLLTVMSLLTDKVVLWSIHSNLELNTMKTLEMTVNSE